MNSAEFWGGSWNEACAAIVLGHYIVKLVVLLTFFTSDHCCQTIHC